MLACTTARSEKAAKKDPKPFMIEVDCFRLLW